MRHFFVEIKKAAKLHTARAVKRCDRFIITGKSVLYFKSSGKVKKKVSDQLAGGFEFYFYRFS